MKVTAIVPSAGTGERIKHRLKKPYISLLGQPILAHTLKVLDSVSDIDRIVVPVFPGEEDFCEKEVVKKMSLATECKIVAGGETRQESVRNALEFLPDSCDIVLIHDGARPFTRDALVARVLDAALRHGAAIPVLPSADTLHVKDEMDGLVRTLDRASIVRAQTPQGFLRSVILDALEDAPENVTDDAAAVLASGHPVRCIAGDPYNLKITHPEDIAIARGIARALAAEGDGTLRHPVA